MNPQVGQTVLDLGVLTNYTITEVLPDGRVLTDGHNGPITIQEDEEGWVTGDVQTYIDSLNLHNAFQVTVGGNPNERNRQTH